MYDSKVQFLICCSESFLWAFFSAFIVLEIFIRKNFVLKTIIKKVSSNKYLQWMVYAMSYHNSLVVSTIFKCGFGLNSEMEKYMKPNAEGISYCYNGVSRQIYLLLAASQTVLILVALTVIIQTQT